MREGESMNGAPGGDASTVDVSIADTAPDTSTVDASSEAAGAGRLPRPSVRQLLRPKWHTIRNRARRSDAKEGWRWLIVIAIGLLFWGFSMAVLVRVLTYFRGTPEIGLLLAGKLLGLVFLSFFAILLLSNIITALSSYFLARDLDMLVAAPVDWLQLYMAKLLETLIHSSWMVALMALPILSAYGYVYKGGAAFVLVALAASLPYFVIPAAVGSAITLVLVNAFPARRTRDLLSVVAVLAAGALVTLFRLLRPERLVRPDGVRSLVDFVAMRQTPTSPFLPSEWAQRSVMGSLTGDLQLLPLYLLWTTAAVIVVGGALLHRALYDVGFSKAQESVHRSSRRGVLAAISYRLLAPLGSLRRELVMKETRVFFRDTTQWSQLILLAVLLVVYVFNVKLLPMSSEGVTFFLVNVVPFLNLGIAGFVLSAIAARFIFPGVSIEGRTLWLLKSSPLPMGALLWSKYWTGTLPLLALALIIVGVTNALLGVGTFIFVVSLCSIVVLTFALASMALGLGAVFPRYESENAAQIPTSFGGLVFMLTSIVLVASVVLLEARPVYSYLRARTFGEPIETSAMVVGFVLAFALCAVATVVPLRVASKKLNALEV
jgi:ABC-2 type transport system permease protein